MNLLADASSLSATLSECEREAIRQLATPWSAKLPDSETIADLFMKRLVSVRDDRRIVLTKLGNLVNECLTVGQ